ncbi:MAG TPA: hypothetical protein VGA70_13465 [Longimicrobiales bacterium]|jgi:hypothetical protein
MQKCPTLEGGLWEGRELQRSGEMLKLSQRDRDRLVVVREMAEGQVKVTRGAELMGQEPGAGAWGRSVRQVHEAGA